MPAFANLQLKNLLEPDVRASLKQDPNPDPNPDPDPDQISGAVQRHLYISPVLYSTPNQAPLPEHSSTDPLTPSPYVVNHKRRRGGTEPAEFGPGDALDSPSANDGGGGLNLDDFATENSGENDGFDDEGFLDPRNEYMSVGSDIGDNDFSGGRQFENCSFTSAQGDFFDAIDDFSSEGSVSNTPSYCSRIEPELHATRLRILEEIEKRTNAEASLLLMHNQWERISNLMSRAGLTFPAPPSLTHLKEGNTSSLMDQFAQEFVFISFIDEAIAKGEARAEAEEAADVIIESKDQEILRLQDKLQYYETVNHELSQRKLVEVAQRQRAKKRSRRRWLWSFTGLSIAIGVSFLTFSYIPQASNYISLLKSDVDSSDSSCADASS
ncbi:hypothetical protein ABFS83_02G081000 [Erythranthe nasuta]